MSAPEGRYFIEEAPEFDYRGGLFFITQHIGNRTLERVMSPHVFMLALRRAAECARKHRFASADILPFEKKGREGGHAA